jgi:hypothetical protein
MWWGDRRGEETGTTGVEVATPAAVVADSGWVEIQASPDGSLVTANGQVIGYADGGRLRLAVGPTRLELSHDQHLTWQQTVPVGVDSVTTLDIALVRATGAVKVVSHPPGAAINLDGQPTGHRTPAVLTDLPVREGYRVQLRGEGLVSWTSAAFAVAADDTHFIEHDLAAASYSLSITTTPPNAEIFLGGGGVGASPVQLNDLPAGAHQVEARLAGYETLTREIQVPAPGNMVLLALQEEAPGKLVIRIINTYAEIWVDGQRLAQQAVNHQVELPAGRHSVELRNPAFDTYQTEIEVTSGETSICEHTFRKGGTGQ